MDVLEVLGSCTSRHAHKREKHWMVWYREKGHDILNMVGPSCDRAPSMERRQQIMSE